MDAILAHREVAPLLSDDHFSVDGTFVKVWASLTSFQPKDNAKPDRDDDPGGPPYGSESPASAADQATACPIPMSCPRYRSHNAEVDFRGERRSNTTHASTTDQEVRLVKKSHGTGAMLCFMGHSWGPDRRRHGADHVMRHQAREAEFDRLDRCGSTDLFILCGGPAFIRSCNGPGLIALVGVFI